MKYLSSPPDPGAQPDPPVASQICAGKLPPVVELRCEYHENPIAVDTGFPRLSWKLSGKEDVQQRGYEIVAGTSPDFEKHVLFCETGKIAGSESVFVPWPGPEVTTSQRVYWKVRVWTEDEAEPSRWSEPAYFERALPDSWKGRWISYGVSGKKSSPPAPYLRKAFHLSADAVSGRLHVIALGLVELELNGRKVHPQAALIPGWSDFRYRAQAVTFDVTPQLRRGDNMLGCILGDGWYAGYLGFANTRQIYGNSPAVRLDLEIVLEDGSTEHIVSNKTWEGNTGPILSSDLYHGENYDARLELKDWSKPGSTNRGWAQVRQRSMPGNLIVDPKVVEPVCCIETIPAKSVSEPAPGVYIFDLGQNIVGRARLRLKGRHGQEVRLRFGEMLNRDGTLYTENLRSAKATDTYIFGENTTCEWEPHFTFHGFRYVELTGVGIKPRKSAITGVVLHNEMRSTGVFECSDARVNQLASNIRWGLKGNFLEVPTDCPQRDERLGWTGDIQVFAKTAAFHYDVNSFLTKWMRDLRDGQTPEGAFPDIAPTFICGFGNAAWADAGVLVPWIMYRRFGDKRILEENYEAMKRWITYQESTSRALLRPPTAYGDWLAVDAVIPEHAPVPSDLIGTAYFARTAGVMFEISKVLNRTDDARSFQKLRDRVTKAFCNEFVTPNGRLAGDCQTAYALALSFDLLPVEKRAAALERLVELIRRRDWHLSTGFVGTPLLCPVLSRFGRHDVAMKLLLQDTYPSWLFTVKNGATTMWERWNSYTPDKGFGDVAMNSFNHYAYGAIGEWLVHYVAGLAPGPEAAGYRHILFRPQFSEGLSAASAALATPYGTTKIAWETKRMKMKGNLVIPPNSFADFIFHSPGTLSRRGFSYAGSEMETFRLDPGEYSFTLQMRAHG